jgi:hypothetical protein
MIVFVEEVLAQRIEDGLFTTHDVWLHTQVLHIRFYFLASRETPQFL